MRLVLLVTLAFGCVSATVAYAQSECLLRPNVVLIINDDLQADLGSHGAAAYPHTNLAEYRCAKVYGSRISMNSV